MPKATSVEPMTVPEIPNVDAIPTAESTNNGAMQWLGYGLLGLIVVGLGGILVVRGRKGA